MCYTQQAFITFAGSLIKPLYMLQLAITWNPEPQLVSFLPVRWYGLLFAAGFIIGYYIFKQFLRRENLKQELLDSLTMYMVIGTIAGARLGHCLFYDPGYYLHHPLEMLLPVELEPEFRLVGYQGLASHGGAIGILISLWLFARKHQRPYLWILDRIAIVGALGGVCIRLGNLMNSEIYGHETSLPWGFIFVRAHETLPKHPTQLYEALAYLVVFFILYRLYFKAKVMPKPGLLIGLFMLLVFSARFFIEFVKENQVDFEESMALNMGQWLSVPFILAGIALIAWSARQKQVQ